MALTDENSNGFYMPVAPAYGGGMNNCGFGGFGGDWGWIILLLLFAGGGWGMGGFGGGYGNMMLGYDFPWLLNGQNGINANTNNGFRDAMLNDGITSIRDGISGLSTQLCGCCGDMQMALANGFRDISMQMANSDMAALNRSFAEQTANTQGFFGVQNGIADLKFTEATEACATRNASAMNTRDIIDSQTRGIQSILDKLCQLELDGYKREAADLRQRLNMSELAASQTAQNAFISQGFANEVDALYNRLNSCPVPSTPVYGRTPIFTCNNNGCGCGCGAM